MNQQEKRLIIEARKAEAQHAVAIAKLYLLRELGGLFASPCESSDSGKLLIECPCPECREITAEHIETLAITLYKTEPTLRVPAFRNLNAIYLFEYSAKVYKQVH